MASIFVWPKDKPYSYEEDWQLQEHTIKPHQEAKRKISRGEVRLVISDRAREELEAAQEELQNAIDENDGTEEAEERIEKAEDRLDTAEIGYYDEIFDGYTGFCKLNVAQLKYRELMEIPTIRAEFLKSINHQEGKSTHYGIEEDMNSKEEVGEAESQEIES